MMTIDEVVQFLQENSQALIMFAAPKFGNTYLNQMELSESDKLNIRNFINRFFELVDNANIRAITEILPETLKGLSNREALLFVFAYSLDDMNNKNSEEINKKENSIKQFISNNELTFSYIRDNQKQLEDIFNIFYATIKSHTRLLVPWLSSNADFLAASTKPEFSVFVNTLPLKHRVSILNFSDNMKSFFSRFDLRHPNITLTRFEAVKNSVRFDPLCYYLTRIKMLSDLNSREIARADLKTFFTVNPALLCFMAFEIKSLAPIIELWRNQPLRESSSRITSALTLRSPNTLSRTQSSLCLVERISGN